MIRAAQRCSLFLLWAVAATALHAAAPPHWLDQYGRKVWHTENGLPQNTVRAILQTRDGYLWIGTEEGLARFNGSDFVLFNSTNTPQLHSNLIQSLRQSSNGDLWISTTNGLLVYRNRSFLRLDPQAGLPSSVVYFVHQDPRGRLWVSTAAGLCLLRENHCQPVAGALVVQSEDRLADAPDGSLWLASGSQLVHLDATSLTRIQTIESPAGAEITAVATDPGGSLLLGTTEGLKSYRAGVLSPISIPGEPRPLEIKAILRARDGTLWIGTSRGLAHGQAGQYTMVPLQTSDAAPQHVETLFEDSAGALWIGTGRGLMRLAQGQLTAFRNGDPLAGNPILAHFEDRDGTLWLGTELDGLTALHLQTFTTYTTANGLSADAVRSVLQDKSGNIWVGTDGGGLNLRTPDGFTALTTRNGLSSNVILSLASSPDGTLWAGTPTGLNRIQPIAGTTRSSIRTFTTSDGLADDFIRSLCVDGNGAVWIGTRHGLTRYAANQFTSFSTPASGSEAGLGSDLIGAMALRHNGDLVIATSGGLTLLHNGRFHNFTTRDGLPGNIVTAIFESEPESGAEDETLWLGTNGSGLTRFRNNTFAAVPSARLPRVIYGLLEDAQHHLWISSRGGLSRVNLHDLQSSIAAHSDAFNVTAFDTSDGLRIGEVSGGGHPAAWRMKDGTLWFATSRGVSMTDPIALIHPQPPLPAAIEDVLIDGQSVGSNPSSEADSSLVLPPGKHRIEFRYVGLNFLAPQKVRYRYKLEGFDRDWIDAGRQRAAFYTNLSPGRYRFRVAAANNDGIWSEAGTSTPLRIRPFLYQTLWFYALLLCLAAAAAYVVYRLRVRRVELVFASVLSERNRIAREIHDTLAQGIVGISLHLEMLSRLLPASADQAREHLDATKGLVRQSLADARSSIWELRSQESASDPEDLPARAGKMLRQLTGSSSTQADILVTGTYRPLPRPVEDELLRIAQEATTNSLRHAECSHIRVELRYAMRLLRLEIRDNGVGLKLNPDSAAGGSMGHYGIQGMKERAARIGATFAVSAQNEGGTLVAVDLVLT
jgi:ligand-binding sensor domain-containing protein/signal transduction histidine kinase